MINRSKHRRQNAGMILLTVLAIVIVMSILLASIISQNLSQNSLVQSLYSRVQAEQLAKGVYWKMQSDMISGVAPSNVGMSTVMDGKQFTVTVDSAPDVTGKYTVNVAYY